MVPTCNLLFVYGTLLSGARGNKGRGPRDRLHRSAQIVGNATVPGRLYDLGQYPGLVVAGPEDDVVHGEVLELEPPVDRILRAMDDYEGIVPGNHPHNEYERRLLDATLETGETVLAWAYVYLQTPRPNSLITSGNWLDRR
jgi:gamma-glutamylcyclotransferase (GGCT)/AIG2-like uncharacterized protein YtfP